MCAFRPCPKPAPRGKPRRKPLRAKGGSRFPKSRHPAFMVWMREQLEAGRRCDGACGRMATDRAHLEPKGRGAPDLGNVVLLCRPCHDRQEKATGRFIVETQVPLYARAAAWAQGFAQETG